MGKRNWHTDYGTTKGHCKTPKGAMIAAATYLIKNDQRHCTIESSDGAVARLYHNSFWGLTIVPVRNKNNVIPLRSMKRA